jgi:hypothetical protein
LGFKLAFTTHGDQGHISTACTGESALSAAGSSIKSSQQTKFLAESNSCQARKDYVKT